MFDRNTERDFKDLPIWQKGMDIVELVDHIMDAAPAGNEMLQHMIGQMQSDAMMIPTKVAGAEGADLYDIRMENAAIIRKAARELVVGLRGLELFGFSEPQYFDMLRKEVEEFRLLFIDWVAGFDKENFIIDRWGLFNPPGVGPQDQDPDDDIPFDPDALMDRDDED